MLAGGRGTRLPGAPDAQDAPPKVLAPIAGLPMLEHVLGWLAREGANDVVICVGYRAEEISRAIGDGARFGIRIRYSAENSPLGTAGAVANARALLDEKFVVAYGDVLADVDLAAMWRAHARSGAAATLAVHPNDHPFDSDRVVTDVNGRVRRLVRKEDHAGPEAGALCSAALYIVERALLDGVRGDAPSDFARDLFPSLLAAGEILFAYRTSEYLKDMGTPERRARVEADVAAGAPARRRRRVPKPALLVDRDGVLVEDEPFIAHADKLRLFPGAAAALARVNRAGLPAACCTNQPVVARGLIDEAGLHALHLLMEGELGRAGAWLDGIFVCPHHPDRGFAGERPELKLECDCRKPAPGLICQAESAIGIDLRASIFVGDRTGDLGAARAAGCLGVGVLTGAACRDRARPIDAETPLVATLADAVALFLDGAPSWRPWLDDIRRAGVVAIGGPSRAGKTVAAAALGLALGGEVLRVSLDRFIRPASLRRANAPAAERLGLDDAARAIASLTAGRATLLPGYDPLTREAAPSEVVTWNRREVLILDGILANTLDLPGAFHVSLDAPVETRAARRRAFYEWKGLAGDELERAARGHADEESLALDRARRVRLRARLDENFRLVEAA